MDDGYDQYLDTLLWREWKRREAVPEDEIDEGYYDENPRFDHALFGWKEA